MDQRSSGGSLAVPDGLLNCRAPVLVITEGNAKRDGQGVGALAHKKKKHPASALLHFTPLDQRAERAIREGRFQQALELVKQLYKAEPTPTHQEMLRTNLSRPRSAIAHSGTYPRRRDCTSGRAGRGPHDSRLVGTSRRKNWPVAAILNGRWSCRRKPDSTASARILAGAADAAMQQEAAGRGLACRSLCKPTLTASYWRSSKPKPAKTTKLGATLQGIGLRSPFLEWKLLLRGFQAYYANDDARAMENWQRSAPDRLPARLAAPFRFKIDAGFRARQTPANANRYTQGSWIAWKAANRCCHSCEAPRIADESGIARRLHSPSGDAVAGSAP